MYKQDLEFCFKKANPESIIQEHNYENNQLLAQDKLKLLKQKFEQGELRCLETNNNDFDLIKSIANEIKAKYKKLLIFGIGGSSLGAQTICGTKFYQYSLDHSIDINFIDNIHYINFIEYLKTINFEETACLIVSKSGQTIETLTQMVTALNFFYSKGYNLNENVFFITEDNNNPINNFARKIKARNLIHNKDIGGRFSCFSNVALLPAAVMDFDIKTFCMAANNVLSNLFNQANNNPVIDGTAILLSVEDAGIQSNVILPYLQRLYYLPFWYAQLTAESLGKNKNGLLPIKALGSIDQHSLLQYFLEGKQDLFFNFITINTKNQGSIINDEILNFKGYEYLKGNTIGDINYAQQEATIESFKQKHKLFRRFNINNFSEESLGALMMHFMLETILIGYARDINPFDQPAVEFGKQISKSMLEKK